MRVPVGIVSKTPRAASVIVERRWLSTELATRARMGDRSPMSERTVFFGVVLDECWARASSARSWRHGSIRSDRHRVKKIQHSLVVGVLSVLLVAAQVGQASASAYPCTTNADCRYEGCNDVSCESLCSSGSSNCLDIFGNSNCIDGFWSITCGGGFCKRTAFGWESATFICPDPPGVRVYTCTSDADCQYPTCFDVPCATSDLSRCNNGIGIAYCVSTTYISTQSKLKLSELCCHFPVSLYSGAFWRVKTDF